MGVQNNNNYLTSIRTHLSRKRGGPEVVFSSKTVEESDRDCLQLKPNHSHNENDPELPFEQPQWSCSLSLVSLLSTSQPSPPQSFSSFSDFDDSPNFNQPSLKIIDPKCIKNIKTIKTITKNMYPNGESSLIRRGTFKGLVDRRPAYCAFANTKSLSHCTFKSCYCMRVPIVPSPLRIGSDLEDFVDNDENDNSSFCAVSMDDASSFSGKIRHISWVKLKNFIEPTTEPRDTWATFDDFNANLSNALDSNIAPFEPLKLKRSFIHDNFKKMVRRSTPCPVSEISFKPHSSPASPSHDSSNSPYRGLTRSLSSGCGGVRKVRSVSSPV